MVELRNQANISNTSQKLHFNQTAWLLLYILTFFSHLYQFVYFWSAAIVWPSLFLCLSCCEPYGTTFLQVNFLVSNMAISLICEFKLFLHVCWGWLKLMVSSKFWVHHLRTFQPSFMSLLNISSMTCRLILSWNLIQSTRLNVADIFLKN